MRSQVRSRRLLSESQYICPVVVFISTTHIIISCPFRLIIIAGRSPYIGAFLAFESGDSVSFCDVSPRLYLHKVSANVTAEGATSKAQGARTLANAGIHNCGALLFRKHCLDAPANERPTSILRTDFRFSALAVLKPSVEAAIST